jgi:hypothetical protein
MATKVFSNTKRLAKSGALMIVASMAFAAQLTSGMALAMTTSDEKADGRTFEPEWMDEPVAAQKESFEAPAPFAGHYWTSVTAEEKLYYYNPENVYPKAVAHGAQAWNALDGRFDGKGVRLIRVYSDATATVLIDRLRDCENNWYAFVEDREGLPDRLGVNSCALNKQGAKIRKHVLTHELGHLLGSGHQRPRFCGRSIMMKYAPCGQERVVLLKPGPRDVSWYRNTWVG